VFEPVFELGADIFTFSNLVPTNSLAMERSILSDCLNL
jgi:hypothetical protein